MRSVLAVLLVLGTHAGVAAQEDGEETNTQAMDRAGQGMDDARGRSHFQAGRNLYDAGAFERAGQEWEEAHRLSGRPELLYNVYVAYRDAGDVRKAAAALRGYLERAEEVQDRVNLEARLASLEEQVAGLEAAEAPRSSQLDEGGEAPAPGSAERPREGGSIAPWVVAGVGAAAMIAGAVTGALALGAVGDIEDACPNDLCPAGYDLDAARGDARTLVLVTDVLLLGGGALVVGGLLWALAAGGRGEEAPPVTAGCSADGCAAALRGSF